MNLKACFVCESILQYRNNAILRYIEIENQALWMKKLLIRQKCGLLSEKSAYIFILAIFIKAGLTRKYSSAANGFLP